MKISSLGPNAPTPRQAPAPAPSRPLDAVSLGAPDQEVVPPKLAEVLAKAGRPYYDEAGDTAAAQAYYAKIGADLQPGELTRQLSGLLERTHKRKLAYEPKKYLYDWLDMRPNLRLRSLYSPRTVASDAPVQVASPADLREGGRSLAADAAAWVKALASAPMDAVALAQNIAEIETKNYFNCEHVVPKSWYGAQSPMVGDLHHLFTCEKEANSLRSADRLTDFPDYDGAGDDSGMGKSAGSEYEPAAGKGAAARATLYFMLRYPLKVGGGREYSAEDVKTLLQWHREEPPSLYEKHRNQEIFGAQGNRNPFIDHPEWAERVDFTQVLA